ncbi:myogenesis-regulating glycosidase-like [Babylonia areolata]|uniref:myogenesis-regulating glycosidase-like n=1 Tax=Babylonia areolata TaxID=304850 RepID=UPI003FD60CEF
MRLMGLSVVDTIRLSEADKSPKVEAERLESDMNIEERKIMSVPRRKLYRCIKIALAITVLGLLFAAVSVHFQTDGVSNFSIFIPRVYKINDVVKLKLSDNTLSFADSASGQFLKVELAGDVLNTAPDLDSCAMILGTVDAEHARKLKLGFDPFAKSVCVKWKDTVLVVNDTNSREARCFSVHWKTSQRSSPHNCVLLSGAHWYGGSLLREQQWPLEDMSIPMQPYISSPLHTVDDNADPGDYGPVLERMWINSGGFGIMADSDEPLHVSINAHQKARLCLKTQHEGYGESSKKNPLTLKYTVCMDRTARYVHQHLVKTLLTLPTESPDQQLMQDPVWSTRGINMDTLTQKQVLDLKIDITKHNFLHSQVHIAGNVSRMLGGLFFDHERFPNAHQMVSELKFEGFSVGTTVLPVVDRTAFDFKDGADLGAFINLSKSQSAQWGGQAMALVDFTKPQASQWMTQRLKVFRAESAVSAFHFTSGEAALVSRSVPLPNPCDYSTRYVQFAHTVGNNSIVAVGYRSQQFPLMVDVGLRQSRWGHDLGLKSIIPSVLTLGLLGYPFVVVGPVGGVPVGQFDPDTNRFPVPDQELYIRWLQLSVFLPGLEMSVGPWQYGRTVVDIAHSMLKVRADRVVPVLQAAVKEFLHTGAPMIRPLWWMAPNDEVAQRIDCEFLVSNKILVAPVLEAGARRRDVYLPDVNNLKWRDVLRGQVFEGGQWLRGYKVDISEVATFVPVFKSQAEYHLRH